MSLFNCQLKSTPNHSFSENRPYTYDHPDNTGNHHITDSSASCCLQEVSTCPASFSQKCEKNIQKVICKGPDIFGKVLGPTADESILVGLQALMDMAGTLEFANSTPNTSECENPSICSKMYSSCESKDASPGISRGPAFCQVNLPEKSVHCHTVDICTDDFKHEMVTDVRKKHSRKYIITHENIAASVHPRKSKCSQTRVLPTSMTCYNAEPCNRCIANMMPCCKIIPQKFNCPVESKLRSRSSSAMKQNHTLSNSPSKNCPCSKFFQQMTTISVLENAGATASCCVPCPPIRPSSTNFATEKSYRIREEHKSTNCDPCKLTTCMSIQTMPQICPNSCDVEIATELAACQQHASVACNCDSCIPISAGVSGPPSVISSFYKNRSSNLKVSFDDDKDKDRIYSIYCKCSKNGNEEVLCSREKVFPVNENKSCVCSLMPKGIPVADAACSCLKVNTSCQYYKSEFSPIETRSTQCSRSYDEIGISCSKFFSDSVVFKPRRKKSVRILNSPYDCADISETRYCMETDKNSSKSVLPLLKYNDEFSNYSFEKPTKISLEMGDPCIPPPMEIRYAITKITKFRDFSTFEVMKSTSKKPKCLPKSVEGVFVLKKEDDK